MPVPAGTTVGDHTVRTVCGGAGTFTVVATPAFPGLTVTPNRATPPVTVTVGGTCAPGTTSVQLLRDGTAAGPVDINQATGEIQAITLDLGAATPLGAHRFTTSCGGAATFTAVAAPAPASGTTTAPAPSTSAAQPSTELVLVPDLSGLTEQQAVTALDGRLHLARITGEGGRIRSQRPAAGSLVPAGSAVEVTFGAAARPASGNGVLWVVIGAGAGLLALGTAAWLLLRRDRRRGGPAGRGGPGAPHGPAPGPVSQDRTLVGPPGP